MPDEKKSLADQLRAPAALDLRRVAGRPLAGRRMRPDPHGATRLSVHEGRRHLAVVKHAHGAPSDPAPGRDGDAVGAAAVAALAVSGFAAPGHALAQDKQIKIGVIYDYTGPFAGGGSELHAWGTKAAIDMVNARGEFAGVSLKPNKFAVCTENGPEIRDTAPLFA